ncbi:hypothetical protein QTO30_00750 [Yoonia sp. GPGPB17]|uniref:hypothetical protein n=1 Tax=Yoonia sp. GPGPB17 TaxID=3026147 RepID=UPI0030C05F83
MVWFCRRTLAASCIALTVGCGGGGGEGTGSGGSFDVDGGDSALILGAGALLAWFVIDQLAPNTSDTPVEATRLFAGSDQFAPSRFATYGIVAFPASGSSEDAGRLQLFCEAYAAGLNWIGESSAPPSRQAVTVWPLIDDVDPSDFRTTLDERCESAVLL